MRLVGSYAWPTLSSRPTHRRAIHLDPSNRIHFADQVQGSPEDWTVRYHLHPSVRFERDGEDLLLSTASGRCRMTITGGTHAIEAASWHPDFGADEPTHLIAIEARHDAIVQVTLDPITP